METSVATPEEGWEIGDDRSVLHPTHHRLSRIPKERFVQMWAVSLCDNKRHTASCGDDGRAATESASVR